MADVFELQCPCNEFQFTDPEDSWETWNGLRGPAGPAGPPGAPGTSVQLRGPVPSTSDLPTTAPSGELWLVGAASPYDGWFYNGSSWQDAGQIAVGPAGPAGPQGETGPAGPGVPTGGSAGQVLAKTSGSDYATSWITPEAGGGAIYKKAVAILATSSTIATVNDSNITAAFVVASIVFANPSAITSDVTWTTAAGSLTLTGTCSSATTADIILVKT